jgi:hypothetical protein
MSKAAGLAEIGQSLEAEARRKVHALKRSAAVSHPASAEHEMMADNVGKLFRRMTKLSTSEVDSLFDELHRLRKEADDKALNSKVDNLIDELHRLRKKIEVDGDLIERAIARHAEHSQVVLQLATIIADNVKRFPPSTS